jgi:hypothetical protein
MKENMSNSSLFRSVLYNNQGVGCIALGQFDGAIAAFTNSLEILRPLLADSVVGPAAFEETSSMVMEDACTSSAAHSMEAPTIQLPTTQVKEPESPTAAASCCTSGGVKRDRGSGRNFVFRDPIEIPLAALTSQPSEQLYTKLTLVVMYNLALSFHLSALKSTSVSRLLRAKRLYEFVFQMHLEDTCDATLLYSLALMNNLGLIYNVLGDEERSSQCFQHMLATMMFLLECDEAHTIKQWDGFISNVMFLIFTEQQPIAPAA